MNNRDFTAGYKVPNTTNPNSKPTNNINQAEMAKATLDLIFEVFRILRNVIGELDTVTQTGIQEAFTASINVIDKSSLPKNEKDMLISEIEKRQKKANSVRSESNIDKHIQELYTSMFGLFNDCELARLSEGRDHSDDDQFTQ